MSGISVKLNWTSRNVLKFQAKTAPINDEARVMTISTGLSVTVVGHRISLDRDEKRRIAVVVVTPITNYVVTGLETSAIKAAADLLAQRARRFFGRGWEVVDWKAPIQARGAG